MILNLLIVYRLRIYRAGRRNTGGILYCKYALVENDPKTLQDNFCWLQDQYSNQGENSGLVLPNAAFAYVMLSLYRLDYRGNLISNLNLISNSNLSNLIWALSNKAPSLGVHLVAEPSR
jgi:hypothetical protein